MPLDTEPARESPSDMQTTDLARHLLADAVSQEQVVHRLDAGDDVTAIRAEVRRLARAQGVRVRTAVLGDALAVVLADAKIWTDPVSTMRSKLAPPRQSS